MRRAELGFDALIESYRPSELIALEYTCTFPARTAHGSRRRARAAYYDVLSTPSTLFNAAAGHGGPAQDALKKFNQYRFVIDDMLKNTRAASIKLEAESRRAGPDHGRG